MPGIPASLTYTTRAPPWIASTMRRRLGPFVVPVHGAQPGTRRDTDRAAERTRPAGVLGRDHVGVAQFFDRAR